MEFDWNKAASRRELIFFGIVVVLLTFFYLRGIYGIKLSGLKLLQAQIQSLELEGGVLKRFLERTPALSSLPAATEWRDIKLGVLEGKVETPYPDLPSLLPRVTESRFREGVRVKGLTFQPMVVETGFSRVDFSLEAAGSFEEVVGFLNRLENLPALLQIKDLVVSVEEGRVAVVRAELSMRFFKKDEARS